MAAPGDIPDPRTWPAASGVAALDALYHDVEARLALPGTAMSVPADAAIDATLAQWLLHQPAMLRDALARAPSAAVARHLWRRMPHVEASALSGTALASVAFALPVVVVAGLSGTAAVTLPAVLEDVAAFAGVLRGHGALPADLQFALAGALVAASAIEPPALSRMVDGARALLGDGPPAPLDVAPAPIEVTAGRQRAHLRMVLGTAVTGPGRDILGSQGQGWAMPATRWLAGALAMPGAIVLALPRAPQRLTAALASGRAAQREVALQLFVADALRDIRTRYGEPVAVVSAHRTSDAANGGELRLSLSSPLAERSAEGFRFPLDPWDRVPDALNAIATLLEDCRVADVRFVAGVHADRDPATGLTAFCRPGRDEVAPLH